MSTTKPYDFRSDLSPAARLAFDEAVGTRDFEKAKYHVMPFVGELSSDDFKTAVDIYEYAFEEMGLTSEDYEDVDPSAYPLIWKLITKGKKGDYSTGADFIKAEDAKKAAKRANDSALRTGPSAFLNDLMTRREIDDATQADRGSPHRDGPSAFLGGIMKNRQE